MMHLGIHGMRPLEQARTDSQKDRQAHRRRAAVHALESARYQVERPSHSHPEGRAAESGELPDVPQRKGADVELFIKESTAERKLFPTLSDVFRAPEDAVCPVELEVRLGNEAVLPRTLGVPPADATCLFAP